MENEFFVGGKVSGNFLEKLKMSFEQACSLSFVCVSSTNAQEIYFLFLLSRVSFYSTKVFTRSTAFPEDSHERNENLNMHSVWNLHLRNLIMSRFLLLLNFAFKAKTQRRNFVHENLQKREQSFFCGGGMKRNDDSNKHKTSIKLWEEEYKIERWYNCTFIAANSLKWKTENFRQFFSVSKKLWRNRLAKVFGLKFYYALINKKIIWIQMNKWL